MNAAYCIGEQNKNIFPINENIDNIAKHPKKQAFSGTPRQSTHWGAQEETHRVNWYVNYSFYLLFDHERPCEVL